MKQLELNIMNCNKLIKWLTPAIENSRRYFLGIRFEAEYNNESGQVNFYLERSQLDFATLDVYRYFNDDKWNAKYAFSINLLDDDTPVIYYDRIKNFFKHVIAHDEQLKMLDEALIYFDNKINQEFSL